MVHSLIQGQLEKSVFQQTSNEQTEFKASQIFKQQAISCMNLLILNAVSLNLQHVAINTENKNISQKQGNKQGD